ncbi:MAG: mannose-1-phosphate guanylyltransferase/mannose-1-phosphate guanylyltransferase [Candidatus Electronema aureum]|uniref:mannose-1-phosphate guanylyltransferase n=1 Tax=Candidatus Electronema aureum TaxID=2005002 RepID=A0A521FZL3_9BACT|nr:MAG: mannose-1-phosphate guanylyltransferase/mannose-1-phosphate guanylyltransferase [Candidatus Electronema aureum]
MRIQPVILAGGTGTRLWPLSRELYPKQLLCLIGEHSLLQTTLIRVSLLPDILPPVIVVGEEHRFLTKSQVDALNLFPQYQLLLEPLGKDTAPAVCGAALFCRQQAQEDILLLVLPADHLIAKPDAFIEAVAKAQEQAAQDKLTTFGIVPDHPETGYGYIRRAADGAVQSFVEKPNLATAQRYLAEGGWLWNSGMFAFPTDKVLAEFRLHALEILRCMEKAVEGGKTDGVFFRFDAEAMQKSPAKSVDYALMEKTTCAAAVEADFGWSDIGSWQTLWEVADKDERGNVVSGDVLLEDVENCLIRSEDTLVAAVGLRDIIVVETADAVLIAPLNRSQDIKKIVNMLKKSERAEFRTHRTVYRPWGSYTTLEIQERFQIKRITVSPGARLSSQMHHHRHEHWVVVRGTAKVENGDQIFLLREDESTYIPLGTLHRLENPGVIPLELIEIQIGSYLGEDDIVRFDDVYGRNG